MSALAPPVLLGPLLLSGAEVPSVFERAATMQPVIHRLVGGGRVVQLMGSNARTRELRGLLLGPDAVARALALEALHDAGTPVTLAVGAWVELVVVTALAVDYTSAGSVITYRLQAEAAPPVASLVDPTLGGLLGTTVADLASATVAATGGGAALASAAAALAGASAPLVAAVPTANATATIPAFDPTASAVALDSVIAGATTVLASSGNSNGLVSSPAALAAATASAGTLAAAVQAGGFLNRANATMAGLAGATATAPPIHS